MARQGFGKLASAKRGQEARCIVFWVRIVYNVCIGICTYGRHPRLQLRHSADPRGYRRRPQTAFVCQRGLSEFFSLPFVLSKSLVGNQIGRYISAQSEWAPSSPHKPGRWGRSQIISFPCGCTTGAEAEFSAVSPWYCTGGSKRWQNDLSKVVLCCHSAVNAKECTQILSQLPQPTSKA